MKQKKGRQTLVFPWQTAEGLHRSFLQMLRECAKFPNHVIEEPGDKTKHQALCLWSPQPCMDALSSAGTLPAATTRFLGDQEAFPGLTAVLTSVLS